MRSTDACYINKTFVEALGYTLPEVLTWDFVWEVSEAAMAKDADGNFLINGQKVMIPFIYKSTDNMMIQMLKQRDAGYSESSGKIEIFNDTTKELLLTIAEHAGTRAFSTFKISSYPANFLNAGQCIFAVDSTAGATWMGTNAPLLDILFVAKFLGTPSINVFDGSVKGGQLFIGEEAVLPVDGVADQQVTVGIRPEGFILKENGALTCMLDRVEVMGRDTSVVSGHACCLSDSIRAIISAENTVNTAKPTVSFDLKPNKVFLFRKDTEERILF